MFNNLFWHISYALGDWLVIYPAPIGGFIKGILRGVRCTKSLRVLFLHRRPPSWNTLVLYSRAVFIFNEPVLWPNGKKECSELVFLNVYTCMGPRNRFQGMNSASLCSLAGRYDNPLPLRFIAPIASLKILALVSTLPCPYDQMARKNVLMYSYIMSLCVQGPTAHDRDHGLGPVREVLHQLRLTQQWFQGPHQDR